MAYLVYRLQVSLRGPQDQKLSIFIGCWVKRLRLQWVQKTGQENQLVSTCMCLISSHWGVHSDWDDFKCINWGRKCPKSSQNQLQVISLSFVPQSPFNVNPGTFLVDFAGPWRRPFKFSVLFVGSPEPILYFYELEGLNLKASHLFNFKPYSVACTYFIQP